MLLLTCQYCQEFHGAAIVTHTCSNCRIFAQLSPRLHIKPSRKRLDLHIAIWSHKGLSWAAEFCQALHGAAGVTHTCSTCLILAQLSPQLNIKP